MTIQELLDRLNAVPEEHRNLLVTIALPDGSWYSHVDPNLEPPGSLTEEIGDFYPPTFIISHGELFNPQYDL